MTVARVQNRRRLPRRIASRKSQSWAYLASELINNSPSQSAARPSCELRRAASPAAKSQDVIYRAPLRRRRVVRTMSKPCFLGNVRSSASVTTVSTPPGLSVLSPRTLPPPAIIAPSGKRGRAGESEQRDIARYSFPRDAADGGPFCYVTRGSRSRGRRPCAQPACVLARFSVRGSCDYRAG